jgi:hypothetical protein
MNFRSEVMTFHTNKATRRRVEDLAARFECSPSILLDIMVTGWLHSNDAPPDRRDMEAFAVFKALAGGASIEEVVFAEDIVSAVSDGDAPVSRPLPKPPRGTTTLTGGNIPATSHPTGKEPA